MDNKKIWETGEPMPWEKKIQDLVYRTPETKVYEPQPFTNKELYSRLDAVQEMYGLIYKGRVYGKLPKGTEYGREGRHYEGWRFIKPDNTEYNILRFYDTGDVMEVGKYRTNLGVKLPTDIENAITNPYYYHTPKAQTRHVY